MTPNRVEAPQEKKLSLVSDLDKLFWGFVCLFVYTTKHYSLKAYCAIWVRRSNFRHQASPHVSPRESTQRRKVELWARNVR
jgi:hypothetical protein